jgi:hypothetical protein
MTLFFFFLVYICINCCVRKIVFYLSEANKQYKLKRKKTDVKILEKFEMYYLYSYQEA